MEVFCFCKMLVFWPLLLVGNLSVKFLNFLVDDPCFLYDEFLFLFFIIFKDLIYLRERARVAERGSGAQVPYD